MLLWVNRRFESFYTKFEGFLKNKMYLEVRDFLRSGGDVKQVILFMWPYLDAWRISSTLQHLLSLLYQIYNILSSVRVSVSTAW